MRNQNDPSTLALAPAASELPVELNEVNGALVLVRPAGVLDLTQFGIDKHQAPWAKQGVHSDVIHTHIPVEVSPGLIEERTFQIPPSLDHASKKLRAARVEGRIKPDGESQLGRCRSKMRVRGAKLAPVGKMALKRNLIPLTNFFWIQVVNHGKCVKLVETWSYVSIFDVRQTAQVNNEIGTAALAGQFIARSFHISIRQTKAFAGPAKPCARLHVGSGKFPRVAQTSNRHRAMYLSVMFPEQRPLRQQVISATEKGTRAPLTS